MSASGSLATESVATRQGYIDSFARANFPTPAPSPGSFRHPRLDEIVKRRNKVQFSQRNVRVLSANCILLLCTVVLPSTLLDQIFLYADRSLPLSSYGLTPSSLTLAFRLLLLTNIVIALRPLLPYLAKQDNLDDIPLTPSQRNLLGLPRSTAASPANAAQPGSYITPPRYRRSSPSPSVNGSGVSNRSNEAQYGASPQSTSRYAVGFSPTPTANSPSSTRRSIFSPSAGRDSPLLHRALTQSTSQNSLPTQPRSSDEVDFSESTRSLLSGRKASGNLADSTTSIPATPSPRSRERVKLDPGVNYKWLYDKGLRADGSPGASSFT